MGPLPNQDAEIWPDKPLFRDARLASRTFSLQTGARLFRYLPGPTTGQQFEATCDGSTWDDRSQGGQGYTSCCAASCCWMARDGQLRLSSVFIHLPGLRGGAVGELFGFLLLCHRFLQLAPRSVHAPDGLEHPHLSVPDLRMPGPLPVYIDSDNVVNYLRELKTPGLPYPEVCFLVEQCLEAKRSVQRAYQTSIDVRQRKRNTVWTHCLCDETARDLMRRGRRGQLGHNFPKHPRSWNDGLSQLRLLLEPVLGTLGARACRKAGGSLPSPDGSRRYGQRHSAGPVMRPLDAGPRKGEDSLRCGFWK